MGNPQALIRLTSALWIRPVCRPESQSRIPGISARSATYAFGPFCASLVPLHIQRPCTSTFLYRVVVKYIIIDLDNGFVTQGCERAAMCIAPQHISGQEAASYKVFSVARRTW